MTTPPDSPESSPPNRASLLPALLRQLVGPSALREALTVCLEQVIASGTRADSAVIVVAGPAETLEVIAGAGPQRDRLIRMSFNVLQQGNQGVSSTHSLMLALPLEDRSGLLVLATPEQADELPTDEARLWETVAALFALAIGLRHQSPGQETDARDRLRSEVMAVLSHELRTPLATVKGYTTALMLDEVDWEPEERLEFLQLIDEECNNMQGMIGDLMDAALVDAGQLRIEPEPVRLPLVVEEIVHEIQSRTDRHRFAVNFPARFPILPADPARIKQVLRNILDNAVKYSPNGGLIVVSGGLRPQAAVISIADEGVGISPEHLNSLFEKYFRVRSATGYHVPGTGLGLPLTRAIVEAHGGQIWAESQLGHGTTIRFTLPLYDVEAGVKGGV